MTRVPSTWWDDQSPDGVKIRDLLAKRDLGPVFAYLKRRGISYSYISRATGLTPSRVRDVALGEVKVTSYEVLERISIGLNIPRQYLGIAYECGPAPASNYELVVGELLPTASAAPPASMNTQELLGVIAAISVGAVPDDVQRWLPQPRSVVLPQRLTPQEITAVQSFTDLHRRMDALIGGGACLESALSYAEWATQLQHVPSTSDRWTQQLHVALADLHSLIGWMAHDVLDNSLARQHLLQSLILARDPQAAQLRANILYRLGRVSLLERRPQDALHLFGLGQLAAQYAGCHASVVILHNNSGWAYAMLDRPDQVHDSLARAEAERALADTDNTPTWAQFALVAADAFGITAVVHSELARHPGRRRYAELAVEESAQAMRLRHPETERRSLAFDVISAGQGHLLTQDYDTAAAHALTAVSMADEGLKSQRVVNRLDGLWELAEPHAAHHAGLAEFGLRLQALHNSSDDHPPVA